MASGKKSRKWKGPNWVSLGAAALALRIFTGLPTGLIVVGALVVYGAGKVLSIMASGLDTTTHNKGDDERRLREAQEAEAAARRAEEEAARRRREEEERKKKEAASQIPLTGDPTADAVITKGLDMLRTIREENAAIPDPTLSAQMDDLSRRCLQIFRTVSDAPSKAPQVRKFINYYLPTTLKILANYRTMQDRGVSVQEMRAARDTTVKGMNMVLTACQKQIDNLHKDNMMDISTDIDVLEQMLRRDGYTESEISGIKDVTPAEPRTAMEAQIRTSGAPIMEFPEDGASDSADYQAARRRYHK